ncbi:MAG: hypothetical protein KU37_05440 [Sulfuricurvum sp. PC08-66]|nr:MAG: hypothetical protein KU37_05440 [Sulfuricurvum sp. PC08-66]
MECSYHAQGLCHSCPTIDMPYEEQLKAKEEQVKALLPHAQWHESTPSPIEAFRNKAKMAVLGYAHAPILGIVNHAGIEVSLVNCPLYTPSMRALLAHIERWVKVSGIRPYRIEKRQGALKYVIVTQNSEDSFMVRLVVASRDAIERIQSFQKALIEGYPIEVLSVNIQPVHMAVLEGEEEHFLSDTQALIEVMNEVPLYMAPQSFFQTNTQVTRALYATARAWVEPLDAKSIWDLFCGVGGFGLSVSTPETQLWGIEIAPHAIAHAQESARALGITQVRFEALDASLVAQNIAPDVVIVNPPRRGIGEALCSTLESLAPLHILYSSCNATTLAQDLARLSHYRIDQAQLFDMFPHTYHYEVLVLLKRI